VTLKRENEQMMVIFYREKDEEQELKNGFQQKIKKKKVLGFSTI
jgi:hypothetical protein